MSCLMSCLKNTENIRRTVLLSSHPALHVIFDILKSAHCHIVKSPLLKSVLPKPPRVVFRNPKSLPDKLVRSKLKSEDEKVREIFHVVEKIVAYVTFYIQATNLGAQLREKFIKLSF